MKSFKRDGKEFIKLTNEEVKRCFMLIDGKAKPSDFEYDLTEAAVLLSTFVMSLEKILVDKNTPSPYRIRTQDLIRQAKELARTLGEAGNLTGEQWDS